MQNYIPPGKKANLSEHYIVPTELYSMSTNDRDEIETINVAWILSRLNFSSDDISETNTDQCVPSWSGFNTLITKELLPQHVVGFLPVNPHPVTDPRTVYTGLKNFQNLLDQLQ